MIKNKKRAIPNFFIALVLVGGISWVCGKFIHLGNIEFTDNAQVKQHLTPVNTRVQGFIKNIYFEEYQPVKKGDTLVVIEDTEYRLKLAQAEADYKNAIAGKSAMHTTINTTQNNIFVTDAVIEEQRVRLKNAETDYKRYQELMKEEAVTPQQFDRVRTEYAATKAKYEQLLRQKQSSMLVKQEQTQRLEQNESEIKLAKGA
jgi:membrane fusion protein, multidrug efflux system